MSKSDEAIRKFIMKWELTQPDLEIWNKKGQIIHAPIPEAISDLTALISEHYYPKEFVEWLSFGSHPFVSWFDEKGDYYTDLLTDKRWNIDELYQYWEENVR